MVLVSDVHAITGVSVHNNVVANVRVKRSMVKKPQREVFLHNKGDYHCINQSLDPCFPKFDTLADDLSVEQCGGANNLRKVVCTSWRTCVLRIGHI